MPSIIWSAAGRPGACSGGLLFFIPVFGMAKYGGTVLKTSLSKDGEKELQDALQRGDATA
jgi:uncharacterized membrane protein